jgi:hypothetical protein
MVHEVGGAGRGEPTNQPVLAQYEKAQYEKAQYEKAQYEVPFVDRST